MPVFMDRARTANAHAATVLCSRQVQQVPQDPQQRHLRIGINTMAVSINGDDKRRHGSGFEEYDERPAPRLAIEALRIRNRHSGGINGVVDYSAATRRCTTKKYSPRSTSRTPLMLSTIGAVNIGTSHPERRFPIGMPPRKAKL